MPAPSKRDKQSLNRFEQNRRVETRIKNLSKSFYRALEDGDEEKARQLRNESQKAYDMARPRASSTPTGPPARSAASTRRSPAPSSRISAAT